MLVDGDIVVYEPFAIFDYLEYAHPQPPLLPKANALRGARADALHEADNLEQVARAAVLVPVEHPRQGPRHGGGRRPGVALHDELFFWEYYYGIAQLGGRVAS